MSPISVLPQRHLLPSKSILLIPRASCAQIMVTAANNLSNTCLASPSESASFSTRAYEPSETFSGSCLRDIRQMKAFAHAHGWRRWRILAEHLCTWSLAWSQCLLGTSHQLNTTVVSTLLTLTLDLLIHDPGKYLIYGDKDNGTG